MQAIFSACHETLGLSKNLYKLDPVKGHWGGPKSMTESSRECELNHPAMLLLHPYGGLFCHEKVQGREAGHLFTVQFTSKTHRCQSSFGNENTRQTFVILEKVLSQKPNNNNKKNRMLGKTYRKTIYNDFLITKQTQDIQIN